MRTALLVVLLLLMLGIAGRMEYEDSFAYEKEWQRWERVNGFGGGE